MEAKMYIYNSNGYYSSDFMITEVTKISPNAQGVEALGYMATLRRVCNANLAIKITTCPSEPQGDEMKCVDYIPPPKLLRCHAKPQSFDSKIWITAQNVQHLVALHVKHVW